MEGMVARRGAVVLMTLALVASASALDACGVSPIVQAG